MPTYFIKRTDYCYDDDIWSPLPGTINYRDGYPDYASAEKAMLKLELMEYRTGYGYHDFTEIREFRGTPEEHQAFIEKLNAFSQANFGCDFLEDITYQRRPTNWSMPRNATLEQVAQFRDLSGIRFYTIVEGNETVPNLVGIFLTGHWTKTTGWITYSGVKYLEGEDDYGMPIRETKSVPYGYGGIEELGSDPTALLSGFFYGSNQPALGGTPEALSDQPNLLRSLISNEPGLVLKEQTGEIGFTRQTWGINWLALNNLLKRKIFELRPLPEAIIETSNGFVIDPY